ncbi:hypothetical protein [Halorhabdus rudnickae]|uniref:hypothetical protein n=1 Tax=Halorhabdus rudnickae TaxID=1775544 RepID=UPI0010835C14|nr:hypothetical protein [Halorhabdus rudnickae]
MAILHALSEIADHYDNRYWWRERFQERIVSPVLARIHGRDGVDVAEREWDNLLILDACRADMFESVIDLGDFDSYEEVCSRGSSSPDWIAANFADRELGDIVYITANPWVAKEAPSSFHKVVDVWAEEQTGDEEIHTDELDQRDLATSPAATVTAQRLNGAVERVADEHPNKRYIVHYFQPHAPCIGLPDGSVKDEQEMDLLLHPGKPLYEGRIEREAVWEAYEENLAYVVSHARQLAIDLGGKSVFTADHGELFGDWLWPFPIRGYAHPRNLRHPALVTVPWAELTVGTRRRIESGATSRTDIERTAVTEQLEKLGYM